MIVKIQASQMIHGERDTQKLAISAVLAAFSEPDSLGRLCWPPQALLALTLMIRKTSRLQHVFQEPAEPIATVARRVFPFLSLSRSG